MVAVDVSVHNFVVHETRQDMEFDISKRRIQHGIGRCSSNFNQSTVSLLSNQGIKQVVLLHFSKL